MDRGLPTSPLVVDRGSTRPVHEQITTWLREGIARGELAPGDRLPGERDLADRLGVSRMTLRQSLAELESGGDVVRIPGRAGGAFVAEPRIEVDLNLLTGLTDQLTRAGRRAGARVLRSRTYVPDGGIGQALRMPAGEHAVQISRIRTANRLPVALETSWFPAALVPGLLERSLSGSIYAVLRKQYGLAPTTAEERLSPTVADDEHAAHLDVGVGTPLMRVERVARLADGTVVEYARDLFRCDRVEFLVRRSPDQPVTFRAVADPG